MIDRSLSTSEAAARLRRDGLNRWSPPRPRSLGRAILAQFVHFFAVMLWIAGFLAIIAGMLQLGVAIFAVIFINGLFAFIQEYRSERAAEKLRDLLPRQATVVRDGKRATIDAAELVVGDLVLLEMGDRISADLRVLESHALSIDVSTITGESVPVSGSVGDPLFAGSFVVEGEGSAEVIATGARTRLAGIAQLTEQEARPRSPLEHELERVVRVVAVCAIAAGLAFFGIALIVGISSGSALLFAIGVMVALVPEGLLPTVTVSLAIGAQRMAGLHALVRRLESVEAIGATTFICTDKTGTLTLNQMSVVQAWVPERAVEVPGAGYDPAGEIRADRELLSKVRHMAMIAGRGISGQAIFKAGEWVAQGSPLDAALDVFSRKAGIDLSREEHDNPILKRFPFDPRRRRMSIVVQGQIFAKGAPEAIFDCCEEVNPEAQKIAEQMAERGLRVLAVASRELLTEKVSEKAQEAESNLKLLGLIGIQDPPRPEVAESIAACRRAGIKVAMITGDHPSTARAIARQVGLFRDEDHVFEGEIFPKDDSTLGEWLDRDGVIVSRVSPEQKLRIARVLEERGHVVAMTGDGVNDGPALHRASIGIAMGRSGTDVAREAADLVLLDDHFKTIVTAIEQGRAAFANARRFLTYHLTDNVAELMPFVLWALSGGRFPLILSVLQVLALDIGTDILPALALGTEAPSELEMKRPPRKRHLIDRRVLIRAFAFQGATESALSIAAFLAALASAGWRPGLTFPAGAELAMASGSAFSAVVLGQMANAFACRSSTLHPGALGWSTNRYLIYAVLVELALLIFMLEYRPVASLLGHAPPSMTGLVVATLAIPAVLSSDRLFKRWKQ